MLKPDKTNELPRMTDSERERFQLAVAEEEAARAENVALAKGAAAKLKGERKTIADLVARLRRAREAAGVSLNEMEARTGINKSSLSRLENSDAPNPTLLTLHRYADAIGATLKHEIY